MFEILVSMLYMVILPMTINAIPISIGSIKDVTSLGTGWIYLEEGDAEAVATSDLESFAMGGSGGDPWTKYYLEVTGYDDEAVYITEWHSN